MTIDIKTKQRQCGECTRCCEGWLKANIKGHKVYPGRACYFLGKNCTIYEDRPASPCQTYNCEWMTNKDFPEWMRPDISNVIVTERIREGIEYFEVKETGKEISSIVLNWLIQEVIRIQKNLIYRLNGQVYKIGNDEFHNKSRNWYSDDKM
jgi:hypothetical protein